MDKHSSNPLTLAQLSEDPVSKIWLTEAAAEIRSLQETLRALLRERMKNPLPNERTESNDLPFDVYDGVLPADIGTDRP